jgi:hypothetical protein
MKTIVEVVKEIQEIANKNQANLELRVVEVPLLKAGECYRQGDLYVFKVSDSHPVGKELDRRQLADGQSIGARHVLLGEFKIYEGKQAPKGVNDLHIKAGLGYAFDVLGDCTNAHPEHSHFKFNQKGRYQVMHQVDLQTLRRVAD